MKRIAFILALLAGIICLASPAQASGTPLAHTEQHACHVMVLYSRHEATRKQAISAASKADPDLNRAIMAYLDNRPPDPRSDAVSAWWYAMSLCGWGL